MDIGAPGHLDVLGGIAHIYALLAVSLQTFESEFQRCGMRFFSKGIFAEDAHFEIACELKLAKLLTHAISALLYGVKPLDTPTFIAMTVLLAVVSVLASFIPAWRAASLDPIETLRNS